MYTYPTHLIYKSLGKPGVETELCTGICAFCGTALHEGNKLKNSVSDAFTNFDLLVDITATHVCGCCYTCLKETKVRLKK